MNGGRHGKPGSMRPFWLTRAFWALALGLFINAYVYGVAVVSISWVGHQEWNPTLLLVWAPASYSAGIGIGGWLVDRGGRRPLLQWAPLGYVGGALLLLAGSWPILGFAGSFVLLATAGTESNTILTYAQELVPAAYKRPILYAELNFVNLGAVALAAIAYVGDYIGTTALRQAMVLFPLLLALVSLRLRAPLGESQLWIESRHQRARLKIPRDLRLRFGVAAAFSFANTTGFSLLSFAFGSRFLPQHFHHMLLVSALTAFAAGLTAKWAGKVSAKKILSAGYGTAFLAAVALYWIERPTHGGFWPILFILSASTSMSYLAEDTFKSDEWPSALRGRLIGAVRMAGLIGYGIVLVLMHGTGLRHLLLIIAMVWAVGFGAAIVWWLAHSRLFKNNGGIAASGIRRRFRRAKLR